MLPSLYANYRFLFKMDLTFVFSILLALLRELITSSILYFCAPRVPVRLVFLARYLASLRPVSLLLRVPNFAHRITPCTFFRFIHAPITITFFPYCRTLAVGVRNSLTSQVCFLLETDFVLGFFLTHRRYE